MSKTKRRKNLKGKLIGCLCLAVIAAGMTTVPVIPCISGMGVINASAETADTVAVDLSKIVDYKDDSANCPTGVTAVYANSNNTIELTLDSGSYKFSGKNFINNSYVDVKIIVPSGKNVQIEFDNAAIINDYGKYADTNIPYYSPYSVNYLSDQCRIYDYAVPFKVEGTLTVSGSLSVDTYSYYDTCWEGNKHGASADLYEGGGTFNKGGFLTIKYVDEDDIVIDRKYYLNGNKSKVKAGYSCLTDPDADNVITARKDHVYGADWESDNDENHYHICSVCSGKADVTPHSYDSGAITTPATETTDGVKTYTCSECHHTKTEPIPKFGHTHSISEDYSKDETGHWHACSGCDEKVDFEAHTEDSGTVTVQPTETSTGVMTYYCSVCGYEMRTEEIPAITPEHTHSYGTEWNSDSTSHWHECSCGEKTDTAQHISNGGVVTVQPTAYTTGVRVYSCSVCGHIIRTETIPATVSNYFPTYPTYPTNPAVSSPSVFTESLAVKSESDGSTAAFSWDKAENADKYCIYQYKDGKYVKIKTTTDTSVTLEDLKNGETYKYLIRYMIDGKLSPLAYSDKITVKVYYKPIVSASAEKDSVTLKWNAVPNAEKYTIYKYADGKAVKLAETEKQAAKIIGLTPDTEYQYIVSAYVDGKWTTMLKSDIVTVRTKAE